MFLITQENYLHALTITTRYIIVDRTIVLHLKSFEKKRVDKKLISVDNWNCKASKFIEANHGNNTFSENIFKLGMNEATIYTKFHVRHRIQIWFLLNSIFSTLMSKMYEMLLISAERICRVT